MPTQRRAFVVVLAVLTVVAAATGPVAQARSTRSVTKRLPRHATTTTTTAPTGGAPAPSTTTAPTTTTAAAPAPAPTTTTAAPTTTVPSTTTTTTMAPTTETRNAADWPFSATSPWNLGVGSEAQFEAATAPRTASLLDTGTSAWINAAQYSHPIYRAQASDPLATVTRNGTFAFQYRIPDDARAAGGTDRHLHVVEPEGRFVHESWLFEGANPLWTTGYTVRTDLWSSGMGLRGVRAYGGSALGGLMRKAELDAGRIPHALALALTGNQLKTGWVWPAITQDGNAASSYFGQVPMGSFVAIPPSVDLDALGLSREGLVIARALQDYGAYVVDRSGGFTLYGEPSLEGTTGLANARRDLARIRTLLRAVTNNSATSVNGGGAPRVPAAPPLAP